MKDRKIHGESNVWSTAQMQKISTDLMLILSMKETIDPFASTSVFSI